MKKNNPMVYILIVLFIASVVYEAINMMLDGISRTWSPGNTDLVARALAASIWMFGIAIASFVIALAIGAYSAMDRASANRYKVEDGPQAQTPKMLGAAGRNYIDVPSSEVEYVGMDQLQNAGANDDL